LKVDNVAVVRADFPLSTLSLIGRQRERKKEKRLLYHYYLLSISWNVPIANYDAK